jgi:hypothetical protein
MIKVFIIDIFKGSNHSATNAHTTLPTAEILSGKNAGCGFLMKSFNKNILKI